MFTVKHGIDRDGWHYCFVKHSDYRLYNNVTNDYAIGWAKPNYPMPAIPLQVKYDYIGCVNIDDVSDIDDPIVVWMYDSWNEDNGETEANKASVSLYV